MSLFEVEWDNLELAHVAVFLSDAGEEGLTWEAKGGQTPNAGSVTKAVCGFANSRGGYLILGAERETEGWTTTGIEFPGGEASTWLASVIGSTLRPVPKTEVKAWSVSDTRALAVVRVEPIAVTPCITNRGVIFERTSGQTNPVSDPSALARLFDQGQRVRERAELIAGRALAIRPEPPSPSESQQHTLAAIAIAGTGLPEDLSRHLFASAFATQTFREALQENLHVGPLLTHPWYAVVSQNALTGHLRGHDATWVARAAWDGSVAFAYNSIFRETTSDDLISILRGACAAGVAILGALEVSGPAYLALARPPAFGYGDGLSPSTFANSLAACQAPKNPPQPRTMAWKSASPTPPRKYPLIPPMSATVSARKRIRKRPREVNRDTPSP
jgi:hypothetical protein